MKMKTILLMTLLTITMLFVGCSSNSANKNTKGEDNLKHTKVQIEMQDGGKMVFELYPEYAPQTVANFIELSKSGFYDGLKFHRIMKGFMIQGGDPSGNGSGGSKKKIKGEFASNGFSQNTLKHTKGVISMARAKDKNSASSQFFVMDGTASSLDGDYAAFGKMIEGEDTLDSIANTPVGPNSYGEMSVPQKDVIIKKVTVLD
ncbi:MAG: peptidylprolyl isomerase [Bacillota bacterium]|nr:peptidylprolyl isomerase [Bacillota bacterium]